MANNASVSAELVIRMRDATGPGAQAAVRTAEQTAQRVATASERSAQRAADAEERGTARSRSAHERLARARESLSIRSENAIRREIQQTEAAYNRLARAGFKSAEDQARAYDKTRQKVTQLTNEMGKLTAAQEQAARQAAAIERGQRVMQVGVAAGAGLAAAAYTLRGPTSAAMSFDERLAYMANTAFNERDSAGRKIGMKELEAAINRSVGKGGGGTREQAADALDSLIASNAMSAADAMQFLPTIMRFSAASNTSPTELASIGIRAMQNFKIAPEDMPNVLNMAMAAGKAGGFELKDMAKWLPQQMAAATLTGMGGRSGFATLAALNQAAAITAGSKDQAGNNVANLLQKINSVDAANNAKKLGYDLTKHLQMRREQGVDSVTAFGELVEGAVGKRADYRALQKKLAATKDDADRRAVLESMAGIAQGTGIGQMIQDQQAMMALIGFMNNREYMARVLAEVKANDVRTGGAGDRDYSLISQTAAFQLRQAQQAKDAGQKAVLDSLTPAIGDVADGFRSLAEQYPLLVGASTLATAAIGALATASGLAALAMGGKLPFSSAAAGYLGRIFGPAALTTVPAGIAAASAPAAVGAAVPAGAAAAATSRWALAGAAGAAVAPLTAMYSVSEWAGDTSNDIGRVQALTATSGVFERLLSMFGLDKTAEIEARRAANRAELGGEPARPAEVDARLTIGLAPGLVITNQSMQSSGGRVTLNTGNINSVP